jgi:hypothetical protein
MRWGSYNSACTICTIMYGKMLSFYPACSDICEAIGQFAATKTIIMLCLRRTSSCLKTPIAAAHCTGANGMG